MKFAKALKYQRTEYGKQIRRLYETGQINERRCNMREYALRGDENCNTITTVTKDNYIVVYGCAMRGREREKDGIQQNLEIRQDWLSNSITTVQKDAMVIEGIRRLPLA